MNKKIYGPFARLIRGVYKLFHPGWKFVAEEERQDSSVYLVHHQNMNGPLNILFLMPVEARIWSLHVFMTRKECFNQFYGYTLTQRYGWPKPFAFISAKVLSWVVPPAIRSFGAISVHRDSMALNTIRASMDVLMKGESVLLAPDEEYTDESAAIGDIYMGFLSLEKLYYRKTKKHLAFVPICCSNKKRTIVLGQAVRFPDGDYRQERENVGRQIRENINDLARRMGDLPPKADVETSVEEKDPIMDEMV